MGSVGSDPGPGASVDGTSGSTVEGDAPAGPAASSRPKSSGVRAGGSAEGARGARSLIEAASVWQVSGASAVSLDYTSAVLPATGTGEKTRTDPAAAAGWRPLAR